MRERQGVFVHLGQDEAKLKFYFRKMTNIRKSVPFTENEGTLRAHKILYYGTLQLVAQRHVHTPHSTQLNSPPINRKNILILLSASHESVDMTQDTPTSAKRKDPVPVAPTNVSPTMLKKRRVLEERTLNTSSPPVHARGPGKASQTVKSSFEEDLNRLTQEISEVGDSTTSLSPLASILRTWC